MTLTEMGEGGWGVGEGRKLNKIKDRHLAIVNNLPSIARLSWRGRGGGGEGIVDMKGGGERWQLI